LDVIIYFQMTFQRHQKQGHGCTPIVIVHLHQHAVVVRGSVVQRLRQQIQLVITMDNN
jgi:hypothetical protein